MKKLMNNLSVIALVLTSIVMTSMSSCDPHPDDDHILSVSPMDLSMGGDKGETASFGITANTMWTISGEADWLWISSHSGDGNTQINLKTIRANETSEPRSVTLTVTGESESKSITITQEAGAKVLYVRTTSEIILSDGYYADLQFVGDVKGFHNACYYADRVKAWTDEDFKRDLKTKPAFSPDEHNYADYVLPTANTNYVYVAVAYNEHNEYGPVVKHEFTSKSSSSSYDAFVGNFRQESTRWTFDINMNTYCDSYYPCYLTDDYSGNIATIAAYGLVNGELSTAFFAHLIETGIKTQSMEPAKRDGSMQLSRRSDQSAIFFWTWGQNAQKVFSGNIQWDYCNSYSSSRAPKRQAPVVDENGAIGLKADKPTIQEVQALQQSMRVAHF